jgi:hypothetical protein
MKMMMIMVLVMVLIVRVYAVGFFVVSWRIGTVKVIVEI